MSEKRLRVLVVDDSVLFRSQIQLALKEQPEIEVVGTASNGKNALEMIALLQPDVVTLDVEMPVMDGIQTVKEMGAKGLRSKVILFSSLSRQSVDKTLEAIHLGAYDFVAKPQAGERTGLSPPEKIREALLPKLLTLCGRVRDKERAAAAPAQAAKFPALVWETLRPKVLVIASSTGGPPALELLFRNLTESLPVPILIAQHMPPVFTASLAARLGQVSGKQAAEGRDGEPLVANRIYVAPGNFHMKVAGTAAAPVLSLNQDPQRNSVRPAADYLFESAAALFGKSTLSVVLTGMGRDGADGATAVKTAGGAVCIQSKESCVVFGMPGAVFEKGHYDFIGDQAELARKILETFGVRKAQNAA